MAEAEGLQEACGVFGVVAGGEWPTTLDVAHTTAFALVGLQHRGQESAGIVTSYGDDPHKIFCHKEMGLVNTVFDDHALSRLKGNLAIGHTRYSTAGGSQLVNCQPFVVDTMHGLIAVAHNGELVNAKMLREKVLQRGVGLSTKSDSELMTQLLCLSPPESEESGPDWPARIRQFMSESQTSYCVLLYFGDKIYAFRDPYGNRPLCLGKLMGSPGGRISDSQNDNAECDGYVVSSESCVFTCIGAAYHREVLPGEIVEISRSGFKSVCVVPRAEDRKAAFCIFEYVYFARPDSIFEGQMVYNARFRCGEMLAKELPVKADLVSTVPESATPAALGFSKQAGIPYVEVLCKNRYVGRTFIQPSLRLRQIGVAKKFGPLTENFRGKRVVLIDDSIVRGNTMAPIVGLLKQSGAKEVHVRVASPPIKYPCYMGINIPTKEELIANKLSLDKLSVYLGADSVGYLSVDGLVTAVQEGIPNKTKGTGHCTACLTANYPVELEW
ncbi:amidophosphoribosyltransferase-like [Lingula anatina]|uniref:Amidophosphoribosyltransferase n=1 Tax=Lingula anatina TaxID=7574 RepID=A0A1S3JJL2_LINAN|nr:amidophosphoribosyltransferase-like [Lingula anatina]|eukprot:XP_013410094.1 amidophosphoribosyltransferase-like [Lingula anatina]